jgi:Predicted transcriptional regulator with C-terminal CBS domains
MEITGKTPAERFASCMRSRKGDLQVTWEDVARATGCSVSSIKLYASGEVMPRIDKAVRIAQYLGFRLEAIATN